MIIKEEYLRFGKQNITVEVSFKVGSDNGYIESDVAEMVVLDCLDEDLGHAFRDLYKYYGIVKHDDIDYKDHITRFDYDITTGEGTATFEFPLYVSDEATDEDGLPLIEDEDGFEVVFSEWLDYDGEVYYDEDTYYLQYLGVEVLSIFN